MKPTIIDSHAHLNWDSFENERDEVIQRAFDSGVCQIVQAGVELTHIPDMFALADRYQDIYNGIGLHPHEAKHWNSESADLLRQACKHTSVVAIGECGLDFFYNHSEKDVQIEVFRNQIQLALELDKPLIIHTRDAWEETFQLLNQEKKDNLRGVFHCFTGGPEHIPEINRLGFYVSFSGIVTFKNSQKLQAAAQIIGNERYLVETDCPYLAPDGKRGRRNEPSYIWITAAKLAELRNTDIDQIAQESSANTRRLFALPEK